MSEPLTKPIMERNAPQREPARRLDQPMLRTDKLVKQYRQRRVVNGVTINVAAGEIVGLLGPNGAGKTTTFNIVVGLIKPDSGEVTFQDQPITALPMYKRSRRGIGY